MADDLSGLRARPNARTSDDRARDRPSVSATVRAPRVHLAIIDPAGNIVRDRAMENARDRVRVATDAPGHCPPVGNGHRGRVLAGGSPARIPETDGETVDRAASHRVERNEEDRARGRAAAGRDRAPVREIVDDRGRMFLGGVGEAADPNRGIGENRDPDRYRRATAMVRSRHIDTGIEPDLLLAQKVVCTFIFSL